MFDVIKIKLGILKYFSEENIYVCGDKIYDAILRDIGTIMFNDVERIKEFGIKPPEHFDAVSFGKFWIYSDLVRDDFIMPLSKTIELLEKELKRLKENE